MNAKNEREWWWLELETCFLALGTSKKCPAIGYIESEWDRMRKEGLPLQARTGKSRRATDKEAAAFELAEAYGQGSKRVEFIRHKDPA